MVRPKVKEFQGMEKLLDVRGVADRLRVSTRQIWKLVSSGRVPRPVRLSRSVRWRESEIDRFIRAGCDMRALEAERTKGAGQ